jgi:hypothetical protein
VGERCDARKGPKIPRTGNRLRPLSSWMVNRQMKLAKNPEFHRQAGSALHLVIISSGNVMPSGQVISKILAMTICRGDDLVGRNIGNVRYKEGGLGRWAGAGVVPTFQSQGTPTNLHNITCLQALFTKAMMIHMLRARKRRYESAKTSQTM